MDTALITPEQPPTVRTVLAGFRPWHPLMHRTGRFHWVSGLRVALCFVGPATVSHLTGRWAPETGIMTLGALLVAIFLAPFDRPREQLAIGVGLALAVMTGVLVPMVLPGSAGRVGMLAVVGLVAGWSLGWPDIAGTFARCSGLALVVSAELPSTAFAARWVGIGGLLAVALTLLTGPLTGERHRSPTRAAPPDPVVVRHHAMRLALALGLAGLVMELVGSATPIRAHALWMSVGVWVVLQPYLHDTVAKAVQRGGGVALGGLLTVGLLHTLPSGLWVGWLFLGLTFLWFGLRSVNYSWCCMLGTPVIVIGFGPLVNDYAVLQARIGWTVAGSLLALAIRFALWPTHGHPRPQPWQGR